MRYSPDICNKRAPPRQYFGQVFYVLRQDLFKTAIEGQITSLKDKNKIKYENIKITDKDQAIFSEFTFADDLEFFGELISQKGC